MLLLRSRVLRLRALVLRLRALGALRRVLASRALHRRRRLVLYRRGRARLSRMLSWGRSGGW